MTALDTTFNVFDLSPTSSNKILSNKSLDSLYLTDKSKVQSLAESCGFIPNRFGRSFGYEVGNAALLRFVEKISDIILAEQVQIALDCSMMNERLNSKETK